MIVPLDTEFSYLPPYAKRKQIPRFSLVLSESSGFQADVRPTLGGIATFPGAFTTFCIL